jgi:NAD(P)-dependent dehydrogenase (short-subunit alcohol dehydrogenase family)
VAADVTDLDALRAAISAVREAFGPILTLVNNAAHDERHAIEEVTGAYWDERMAVNLRHQFFASQAVLGDMRAAGNGTILNMGSVSWRLATGGMPAYVTAKAAIEGLTRGLARDLGPDNIRVNCVVPGWIMTRRQVELWLTPEAEQDLLKGQCLKRKLIPEDVARLVLFLASDEASGCTAQTFVVDGGWS